MGHTNHTGQMTIDKLFPRQQVPDPEGGANLRFAMKLVIYLSRGVGTRPCIPKITYQ